MPIPSIPSIKREMGWGGQEKREAGQEDDETEGFMPPQLFQYLEFITILFSRVSLKTNP